MAASMLEEEQMESENFFHAFNSLWKTVRLLSLALTGIENHVGQTRKLANDIRTRQQLLRTVMSTVWFMCIVQRSVGLVWRSGARNIVENVVKSYKNTIFGGTFYESYF